MHTFFLLLMMVVIFPATARGQQTLVFAQINDAYDQRIAAEILKVAYRKIGVTVTILEMPGKRALKESSLGRVDGEVQRILEIAEMYPTLIRVPTAISAIEPAVFSKNWNFQVSNCAALKDYRIGIVRGVKYAQLCTQGMAKLHMVNYPGKLIELLAADRIDVAILSKDNGLWLTQQLGVTSVHLLSPSLMKLPLYHYVNEKHRGLVAEIDAELQKMQVSGEMTQIRKEVLSSELNLYKLR